MVNICGRVTIVIAANKQASKHIFQRILNAHSQIRKDHLIASVVAYFSFSIFFDFSLLFKMSFPYTYICNVQNPFDCHKYRQIYAI